MHVLLTDPDPTLRPVAAAGSPGFRDRLTAFGRPPRIMGLDVARGLAVLGMVGAHMGEVPLLDLTDPTTWGGIIHGRSAILFAVLAGVSVALVTGRRQVPAAEDLPAHRLRLLGRGAAIFLIGVVLELLNTNLAVILCTYGLLFIAAIPFLRWSARRLFVAAAALAVAGPVLTGLLGHFLLNPFSPGVALALYSTYPLPVWLALMLAGMGLGRLDLTAAKVATITLAVGVTLAASGYAVGAVAGLALGDGYSSSWSGSSPDEQLTTTPGEEVDLTGLSCDDFGDGYLTCYPTDETAGDDGGSVGSEEPVPEDLPYSERLQQQGGSIADVAAQALSSSEHSGGVLEVIGSGGFALAVIGACLLLARPLRWLLFPIACVGTMPLTAYTAHVLVYFIVAGGPQGVFPVGNTAFALVGLGLVVAAVAWALTLGRGPLERLVAAGADAMARGGQ